MAIIIIVIVIKFVFKEIAIWNQNLYQKLTINSSSNFTKHSDTYPIIYFMYIAEGCNFKRIIS